MFFKKYNYITTECIKDACEFNDISDINYQFVSYGEKYGYWIIKNAFKDIKKLKKLQDLFPFWEPSREINHENYMIKSFIHPFFMYEYQKFLSTFITNVMGMSSVLQKEYYTNRWDPKRKTTVYEYQLNPHTDSVKLNTCKVISQIWISEGYNGSTKFWKFRDSYILNQEYLDYVSSILSNPNPKEISLEEGILNYSNDNFVEVGEAPGEYGTITLFLSNQYHSPGFPIGKRKSPRDSIVFMSEEVSFEN